MKKTINLTEILSIITISLVLFGCTEGQAFYIDPAEDLTIYNLFDSVDPSLIQTVLIAAADTEAPELVQAIGQFAGDFMLPNYLEDDGQGVTGGGDPDLAPSNGNRIYVSHYNDVDGYDNTYARALMNNEWWFSSNVAVIMAIEYGTSGTYNIIVAGDTDALGDADATLINAINVLRQDTLNTGLQSDCVVIDGINIDSCPGECVADQGGAICTAGQTCEGGSFGDSSDAGAGTDALCCIGGTCTTPIIPDPVDAHRDLSAPLTKGSSGSYDINIDIINIGDSTTSFYVEENVPAGWTIVSTSPTGTVSGNKITWFFTDGTIGETIVPGVTQLTINVDVPLTASESDVFTGVYDGIWPEGRHTVDILIDSNPILEEPVTPPCTDADSDLYSPDYNSGTCDTTGLTGFEYPECDGTGLEGINPGMSEDCTQIGVDIDCDRVLSQEECPCTDGDGDTYNIEGGACGAVDCDDDTLGEPAACAVGDCGDFEHAGCARCIRPGATEICDDGIDQNCVGGADEAGCVYQINPDTLRGRLEVVQGRAKGTKNSVTVIGSIGKDKRASINVNGKLGIEETIIATQLSDVCTIGAEVDTIWAVGGPCVNPISAEVYGNPADCAQNFGGDAHAQTKVAQIDLCGQSRRVVVIAGSDYERTRLTGNLIAHFENFVDRINKQDLRISGGFGWQWATPEDVIIDILTS